MFVSHLPPKPLHPFSWREVWCLLWARLISETGKWESNQGHPPPGTRVNSSNLAWPLRKADRQTGTSKGRDGESGPGHQMHTAMCGHLPGKTCILYRSLSFSVRSPWHAAPRNHGRTSVKCGPVCSWCPQAQRALVKVCFLYSEPRRCVTRVLPRTYLGLRTLTPGGLVPNALFSLCLQKIWPLLVLSFPFMTLDNNRKVYHWSWHWDPRTIKLYILIHTMIFKSIS